MTTTSTTGTLYVALELGQDKWLLACATQAAEKPRYRGLPARDLGQLQEELAKAKQRFGLPADAPVCTCYEAGRDGFWLHRALTKLGITNVVVDSGAIEVNRRRKHVKSDPVDAAKLLNLLCRYHGGERKVFSVVNVPTVADEDRRQRHRGLKDLQQQQTECSNRIKGLLASQGLDVQVDADFRTALDALRDWADQQVPAGLRARRHQGVAERGARRRQRAGGPGARGDGTVPGQGAAAHGAEGRRRAQRLDLGDGTVRLAGHQKRQGVGGAGGPDADALRQRDKGTGAGDQQGGQQTRPRADRGVGLAVAALAAGQRLEPVVSAALRRGE